MSLLWRNYCRALSLQSPLGEQGSREIDPAHGVAGPEGPTTQQETRESLCTPGGLCRFPGGLP